MSKSSKYNKKNSYYKTSLLLNLNISGHLYILSQKYFLIASVDKEKSEYYNDMFYGFCTERKSAKNCQRNRTCSRSHYVMQ